MKFGGKVKRIHDKQRNARNQGKSRREGGLMFRKTKDDEEVRDLQVPNECELEG